MRVFKNLLVFREQGCIQIPRRGHNQSVGRVGVKLTRQLIGSERDRGRELNKREAGIFQSPFHPDIRRRGELQSLLMKQHGYLPK